MPDPSDSQPDDRTLTSPGGPDRPTVSAIVSAAIAGADDLTRVKPATATPPSIGGAPAVAGYALDREIARGGMGAVYAARDLAFGREVAVKVMLPGMSAAAFDREARITARLPHPGIPPVHALGTLPDGRPFLAMKLIRGDTLKDLLDRRDDTRADRARLLGAFEQMCQAVGYAHAQGIVHRDLKPANVMVGAFGEVQVMDWGLAKETCEAEPSPIGSGAGRAPDDIAATVAGHVKGTPAYMSPEQARGEPVDPRADVFALGGILATILTGRPPFAGDSVLDTIVRAANADLAGVFERLGACGADEELVGLAKWCLGARAADRPADGAAVAGAVAAYRAGVDARLRRAEQDAAAAEARAAEQRKRRRVQLVLAAVVAATLAGAGLATALVLQKQADDKLAAEQRQADERLAAEQVLADERLSAERKRQDDLRAADRAARDRLRQARADALVRALAAGETSGVRAVVADLAEVRDVARPALRAMAVEPVGSRSGLHARLALLADEGEREEELVEYLLECRPGELLPICAFLKARNTAFLGRVMADRSAPPGQRVRAACACAALDPRAYGEGTWVRVAPDLVGFVTRAAPDEFVTWSAALDPVREYLVPPLRGQYPRLRQGLGAGKMDLSALVAAATAYDLTANLLARYASAPTDLAEMALISDPRHFGLFAARLREKRAEVVPVLVAEVAKVAPEKLAVDQLDAALEAWGRRRGYAAAALVVLGEGGRAWPLLMFPRDGDPTARSYLIERLSQVGADPGELMARFAAEPDTSAKRALLLALGDVPPDLVPTAGRERMTAKLLAAYREHPDPGLHGAIDWLLRQRWGKANELAAIDAELAAQARGLTAARLIMGAVLPVLFGTGVSGPQSSAQAVGRERGWFVSGEGQTFAVVRGPVEFTMGSPESEPGRAADTEPLRRQRIGYTFAIATKEVTVEQFLRFRPGHVWLRRYSPGPDTPAVSVTWYEAAAYCNWLSERDGIPRDQWCYEPNPDGLYAEGMRIRAGHLGLAGYRLPATAEWELASRGGAATARYFGRGEELLPRYGWFLKTSEDRVWPVGRLRPGERGIFDALGNVGEWSSDAAPDEKDRAAPADTGTVVSEQIYIVRCGGSFDDHPIDLRLAYRYKNKPGERYPTFGFRVARALPGG